MRGGGGEEVQSVTGAESQLLGQLDISSTQLFTSAWPALAKPTSLCCRQNLCLFSAKIRVVMTHTFYSAFNFILIFR